MVAIILFNTYTLEDIQPTAENTPLPVEPLPNSTEHLAKALTFQTISHHPAMLDTAAFDQFHNYLFETYPNVFSKLEVDTIGSQSLLLHWKGTSSEEPILFMAHQDVVPVEGATLDQWESAPFEGNIKDGYLYGRGTLDDKGSLISILEAAEALLTTDFKPQRDIYLFFGQDEEIGGGHGAELCGKYFEEKGTRFRFVLDEGGIISDGIIPGISQPVALIGTTEKGFISVDIEFTFEGGHSSMPGDTNSITLATEAIRRLKESDFETRLCDPIDGFLHYLGPHFSFTSRMAAANRWLFEGLILSNYGKTPSGSALIKTTWAPTIIRGGIKDNVIPSRTVLTCNSRILPGETSEEVVNHYKEVLDGLPVTIAVHSAFAEDPSPVTDHNGEVFRAFASTVKNEFPEILVAPYVVVGATDGRHFVNVTDNVMRFMPFFFHQEDLKRMHNLNERVAPEAVERAVGFYIRAMYELSN